MNFFAIRLGLNAASLQSEAIDFLKSHQAKVLQSSNGLWVSSSMEKEELQSLLNPKFDGLTLESIDSTVMLSDPSASPDLKAFLNAKD